LLNYIMYGQILKLETIPLPFNALLKKTVSILKHQI